VDLPLRFDGVVPPTMDLATSPEIYLTMDDGQQEAKAPKCPTEISATLSLDALAERLAPQIAPQFSAAAGIPGVLAERSGTLSATGSRGHRHR